MKRLHRDILCALFLCLVPNVIAFEEFAVYQGEESQQLPDVENGIIVWQQNRTATGWDVVGVDMFDEDGPTFFVVDDLEANQQRPAIWNRWVVWQDNSAGDWDVYLTDITDLAAPQTRLLTNFFNDQTAPAIHGNTVIWQHQFDVADWDIYAADITDPNNPISISPFMACMAMHPMWWWRHCRSAIACSRPNGRCIWPKPCRFPQSCCRINSSARPAR